MCSISRGDKHEAAVWFTVTALLAAVAAGRAARVPRQGRGEAGDGLAAPAPGLGREPGGGAPRVLSRVLSRRAILATNENMF
jgi:hypothetical protein